MKTIDGKGVVFRIEKTEEEMADISKKFGFVLRTRKMTDVQELIPGTWAGTRIEKVQFVTRSREALEEFTECGCCFPSENEAVKCKYHASKDVN